MAFFFNLPDMQIFQIKKECAVSTAKCMKIWKKMMTLSQMFLPDLRDHNFLASIYIYIHPHAAFFSTLLINGAVSCYKYAKYFFDVFYSPTNPKWEKYQQI